MTNKKLGLRVPEARKIFCLCCEVLAQDIVEVEERENLSLKGINRIVKCFAVKDRKPAKVNKSSRLNRNKKFKNKNG